MKGRYMSSSSQSIEIFNIIFFVVPIILTIVILGLFFWLQQKVNHKKQQKFANVAKSLGLSFEDTTNEIIERYAQENNIYQENNAIPQKEKKKQLRNFGMVKRMITFLGLWRISGVFQTVNVIIVPIIRNSGKSQIKLTQFFIGFESNLQLGLHISNGEDFSSFKEKTSNYQDIQIGNELLDQKLVIKGLRQEMIREMLTAGNIQNILVDAYQWEPNLIINDEGLLLEKKGIVDDEQQFRFILEKMIFLRKEMMTTNSYV
ncbi:MAG: hypothetical protein ACI86H_002423 [bacterium]|jgi:hypothetical protein